MRLKAPIDPVLVTDLIYLAKTVFGEGRSEGYQGMYLIGWVIRNRVEHPSWPDTYASCVTQRQQFSAWLKNDPNYNRMADPLAGPKIEDMAWYDALRAADAVMDASPMECPIPGVYHYVDISLKNNLPSWAANKEQIITQAAPNIIFLRGR